MSGLECSCLTVIAIQNWGNKREMELEREKHVYFVFDFDFIKFYKTQKVYAWI